MKKVITEACETAIKNTTGDKQYYIYDDMNYRCKNDLFLTLAATTNNTKTFSIFFWMLNNMDGSNIVRNYKPTELITKSKVSRRTYYQFIKAANEANLFAVIPISKRKNMIMINPELIYNFRKTKSKDRIEIIALYNEYRKQTPINSCVAEGEAANT